MPFSTWDFPIRIPKALLEELGAFAGISWCDNLVLEPLICDAIRNYMKAAALPPQRQQQQQQQQPVTADAEAGYQWKQLFLPNGTRLRACFDLQNYFATIEGEQIRFGEHTVSPSTFANLHGSGNRNAWKAIWLRFPGSDEWLLADVCRAGRKAAVAALTAGAVRHTAPAANN